MGGSGRRNPVTNGVGVSMQGAADCCRRPKILGLAVLLATAVAILFAQGARLPNVLLGVVVEATGSEGQLIRLRDLQGATRVLYLPAALTSVPVSSGEHVLVHQRGITLLSGREYAVVRRLWRLPRRAWSAPIDLLRELGPLTLGNTFEAGVVGLAVVCAPGAILDLGVAIVGGAIVSASVWFVLQFAAPSGWRAQDLGTPVVLTLAFLFGATLATN